MKHITEQEYIAILAKISRMNIKHDDKMDLFILKFIGTNYQNVVIDSYISLLVSKINEIQQKI